MTKYVHDFSEGNKDMKDLLGLEQAMEKKLGDPEDPLLVSVRSGAKFSMPGMMDTVLNLGLNEDSLQGLAKQSEGDWRFSYDAYRRFIQMFGKIVMGVPGEAFEDALDRAKQKKGPNAQDTDLDVDDLKRLVEGILEISFGSPSRPCSSPGTGSGPSITGARTRSLTTLGRRSTWWPWCSATGAWTREPGWPSRETPQPA